MIRNDISITIPFRSFSFFCLQSEDNPTDGEEVYFCINFRLLENYDWQWYKRDNNQKIFQMLSSIHINEFIVGIYKLWTIYRCSFRDILKKKKKRYTSYHIDRKEVINYSTHTLNPRSTYWSESNQFFIHLK